MPDGDIINCPICDREGTTKDTLETTYRIKCPVCGTYNIGTTFDIPEFNDYEKAKLRYYYYTMPADDIRRVQKPITSINRKEFLDGIQAPRTITEKFDNVLYYLKEKTKFLGQEIEIERPEGYRRFFCINDSELNNILEELKNQEYIMGNNISVLDVVNAEVSVPSRRIVMTAKGLKYAESLYKNIDSLQCFVAMWFNSEEDLDNFCYNMDKVYSESIKPAIENNQRPQRLKSVKIDNIHHNDDVVDRIIAEIHRSKFVVVDLTGYRGGVYYEAGFAEGLGLPVIYTCNREWLKGNHEKNIPSVPFDTSHKNILAWDYDKLEEFKTKLTDRINAIIP